MWYLKTLIGCICVLLFLPQLQAQLPEEFFEQTVVNGLEFPTGVVFDQRGYGYIWQKRGTVLIMDSTGQVLDEPLIDLREEITDWKDHGLLGFCLDNNFAQNGYFYLLYAVDWHHYQYFGTPTYHPDTTITYRPTFGRITRYQASVDSDLTQADIASREVLLGTNHQDGIPLLYSFHGLGSLLQATDGTLLVSIGDATSNAGTDIGGDEHGTMASEAIAMGIITEDQDIGSYRSQYLGNLNGKILRIDPEKGDGLSSNPFFDSTAPRSAASRTWALGFRNPYRISLVPETGSHYPDEGRPGQIMVGEVGNGAWEELNLVEEGGQNFGWPIFEGYAGNWAFVSISSPENQLAPNPLYNGGSCDREFFNFKELLPKPREDGQAFHPNPCNSAVQIPADVYPMKASQALLRWSNAKWNQPTRAELPGFKENGDPTGVPIDDPERGIEGEHFDGYSSLAGVYYPGTRFPETYQQQYFHLDYSGWIKVMRFGEDGQVVAVERFHDFAKDIIHLAYNPYDESLYYINIQGEVRKISYGGNQDPVALIVADQFYGPGPLTVNLDASQSFDPNGDPLEYFWDFGDGQTAEGQVVSHQFGQANAGPQQFNISLEVRDNNGGSNRTELIISPNNSPPRVDITSFEDGDLYPTDRTTLLSLVAEAEDDEHGPEELMYIWRAFVHHNDHFHPEPPDYAKESFYLVSPLGCTDEEIYWYEIMLTVTDPAGLSTTLRQNIYPNCDPPFAQETILTGEEIEQGIRLDWPLQTNINLQKLELQRSYDYLNFQTIKSYTGSEINIGQAYQYLDSNPAEGTLVYRLKLYGEGSVYDYSNLVAISYPSPPDWRIFPNPGSGLFQLEINEVAAGSIQFELFSAQGQRLRSLTWPGINAGSFSESLLLTDLPAGVYFYRVKTTAEEYNGQLIKE